MKTMLQLSGTHFRFKHLAAILGSLKGLGFRVKG